MLWFAEGLGRKARHQGLSWLPGLGKALNKLWSPSGLGRGPEGGELVIEKILSIATEVCRTHAPRKPITNAYCRTTWRRLPVGWHPFLWFDSYQERTSIISWFYFSTTTVTDTQGIGKILLFSCTHYSNGTCTVATRTEETSPVE